MPLLPTGEVAGWFRAHADDGEFVSPGDDVPWLLVPPEPRGDRWLYCTKPQWMQRCLSGAPPFDRLGIVARHGLPSPRGLAGLSRLAGRGRLLFVGDLDPPDLMIFAFLRDMLREADVRHLGIGARFAESFGLAWGSAPWMPLSPSERAALDVLRAALPDLPEVVGPEATRQLAAGCKLELDGVATSAAAWQALIAAESA